MSKPAVKHLGQSFGKRSRTRLRLLRRRAQAWKKRVRQAAALSLAVAAMWGGQTAVAQLGQVGQAGQMGMAPAGGIVNRAVAGFQQLDENGPGWLYYGVNAADRGLGYNGSYFTLGGFIPYAEDDLGGLWSADLRSHLSTYGGFFSNVGIVRKQFIGGTIGGLGIYWDYDADMNQYPTSGECGTGPLGQFGHVYNQVGVSAEWLTDYGNLRSNGYIPVGTTAHTAGNPGSVFFQNYVMCNYGLDAALTGADLEVGAYVPGLADWSGMVSVGGYTFGQARYNWNAGSKAGQDVVPYFGGVYTRLDMTLIRNWDFSLQANNDSYFDWTGFARLTYRMGGSRRRNVPDQMEQPMMRNEHIVRAHQTPKVAINPATGTPWRVIHVNNASTAPGNGSAESPFTTLGRADTAATNPWDVVLVARGNGTATGYNTEFSFNAPNQSLVGMGSAFHLNSICCGPINIGGPSGPLPLLSNPAGASVFIDGAIAGGAHVANLNITGSQFGIAGTGDLTSAIGRPSSVNNVTIAGSGLPDPQTGVYLQDATGGINFTNTAIADMTNGGFVVDGGDPNVNYQGSITSDVATNGGVVSPIVEITNTTGGVINLAVGAAPNGSTVANSIVDTGGAGIVIANNTDGTINIGNAKLTNTVPTAITVEDSAATINVTNSVIEKDTAGAAINVAGGAPIFDYKGKITNQQGNILHVDGTTAGSVVLTSPTGSPFTENGDGILVENSAGDVTVLGANIASQQEGILVQNSGGSNTFNDITITAAVNAGVSLQSNLGTENFNNLKITTNGATGLLGNNDNIINITGNSSIASTTAAAVSLTNVAALNANFKSLTSTDSPTNGILLDNVVGIFNSNTATVTNSAASGVVIRNSEGLAVSVPVSTTVSTGSAAGANGIEVTNTNTTSADAINFGTVAVTTANGTGLLTNNTGLVTTAGGTIAATGGAAISATDSNLGVQLTSASSTNSTSNGINLVRDEGSVAIGQTTITNATGVGINAVDNDPGFTANFGVTNVNGAGAEGVNIVNATDPNPDTVYTFSSLDITTTTTAGAAGFRTRNGGTVNFDSPANVAVTGGAAVDMENTTGTTNGVAGSGFTFNSLTSTDSASNGIRLVNLNSDFKALTTATVTNAGGDSVLIADNQVTPPEYKIQFNTLDINNRQDVGLQVNGIAGQLIIDDLQINNTAGVAGDAVRVEGTSDRGATGGRVYIQSGVITDTQGNGVFAQNSILSIDSTTITNSTSNAIFAYAATGDITTISVVDSSLTAATIAGVRLEALGSGGEVNGTILRNQIDVTGNSINAIALDSNGSVFLNAQSNYGTLAPYAPAPGAGAINLDNTFGGTVGIFQGSTAALSTSNNGATVNTSGIITVDAAVPVPPPPAP